jgi:GNAT superfamily N-acetyltransferase
MTTPRVGLRAGTRRDLDAVNAVVERAVMTWDLPERVKRLSMATYRYTEQDLEQLQLVLAESADDRVLGVAAWEGAEPKDTPAGCRGLLLHGIYVDPAVHRGGVGTRLLAAAEAAARAQARDGVLVKAQRGAEGFFVARGFRKLAVQDPARDYPHRLWKPVS